MMKSGDGGSAGSAREQVDRQVERSPPRVDGRRAAAVGRPERGQHERGLGRGGEVVRDLRRVVARVLVSSSSGTVHGTSCGVGSISTGPHSSAIAVSSSRRHLSDGAVRRQRHSAGLAGAVLDGRLVRPQVEQRDDRARPVGGRQRRRLPPSRGQPQRRVLELGLGRRQLDGQLAEHLRVGVERVAGRAPPLVVHRRPGRAHLRWTLPVSVPPHGVTAALDERPRAHERTGLRAAAP